MWYLYIAQCNDDALYTGITTDVHRRELEHNTNNAKGAKSLRNKRPIKIVYTENIRHNLKQEKGKQILKVGEEGIN